jgi:hypothetical protein
VAGFRRTALAINPESVGWAALAEATVVSARNRLVRNSFACGGLGQQSLVAAPHRLDAAAGRQLHQRRRVRVVVHRCPPAQG